MRPAPAPLHRPCRSHALLPPLSPGSPTPHKQDFKERIRHYEDVYETITDRSIHYIKLIDMVTGAWAWGLGGPECWVGLAFLAAGRAGGHEQWAAVPEWDPEESHRFGLALLHGREVKKAMRPAGLHSTIPCPS